MSDSNVVNTSIPLCGNCEYFVVGGLCELVMGQISAKSVCDLHHFGNPNPINITVNPKYRKSNVNYKPGFFVETTQNNPNHTQTNRMINDLRSRGIPEEEIHRAVTAYFSEQNPPDSKPWPGPITGLDLAGEIDPVIVPDTGTPLTDFTGLPQNREPYPTPNKSPYGIGGTYQNNPTPDTNNIGSMSNTYEFKNMPAPYSAVWNGLASDVNSEPSMHGEHGYHTSQSIPPWRYNIEDSQTRPITIPDIVIPPSGINPTKECSCKKRALQEAISNLRSEFVWLTDDYVQSAKKLAEDAGGVLYLIRAAGETITNHMSEGEPYRRKLSADELNSMTRTIIGKSMDINHQPEFEVNATILDAEFDKHRKEIQTLVIVKDDTINDAIDNRIITAVSINGGMPRTESVEPCVDGCTDDSCELCLVPKGVVLGELDGIGMTFVVTDSNGLYWNGHHVPRVEPGIKFTLLQKI